MWIELGCVIQARGLLMAHVGVQVAEITDQQVENSIIYVNLILQND